MFSLMRYHFLVFRRESFWLPAGLAGLCALLALLLRGDPRAIDVAGAYLAYVLPLSAGVLASGAILDDPSLELHLAAPRRKARLLVERLIVVLAMVAAGALAFQAYSAMLGVELARYGGPVSVQLLWIVPSLALAALGTAAALVFVGSTFGALLVGLVWIAEILLKDWFLAATWRRYLLLFLGERWPDSPDLVASRLCLAAIAVTLLVASIALLRREERYV